MKLCPSCSHSMEQGFVVDFAASNAPTIAVWHRGVPIKGWLGLKTRKADKLAITALRSTACGLLESYAN